MQFIHTNAKIYIKLCSVKMDSKLSFFPLDNIKQCTDPNRRFQFFPSGHICDIIGIVDYAFHAAFEILSAV